MPDLRAEVASESQKAAYQEFPFKRFIQQLPKLAPIDESLIITHPVVFSEGSVMNSSHSATSPPNLLQKIKADLTSRI